jgi:capsule polysaccharide export protein KpsE/RkpR
METLTPQRDSPPSAAKAQWAKNLLYLWGRRRTLLRVGIIALVLSTAFAFLVPKRYDSSTSIMPPEPQSGSAAMLAMLAGRAGGATGGLGSLAGGLLGARTNGDLYIDLLHSGSVMGGLIDRFHLQQVYHTKYAKDTFKKLAAKTKISENKKSGIITIVTTDTDQQRAEDLANGYVEELNKLMARVNTSSARREREFIEQRLASVVKELNDAEEQLSRFSSSTSTIDIKEQTRATVDAGAKLQAELIVAQSELQSLRQIYGDENVRVRSTRERIGVLQRELDKMGGSAFNPNETPPQGGELYPPLRSLPELGVRYANLYRHVRVEEAVYDLLSAEYETARIQEAKEIATVSVVDFAGWPETKSFPSRRYFMLGGTFGALLIASFVILVKKTWRELDEADDLKVVARHLRASLPARAASPGEEARP